MYVVSVYVTNDALAVNKTFSYKYDEYIENFKRVKVIFNHVKTNGIVVACVETDIEEFEKTNGFKLSPILEVLDSFPIIDERQFELAKWLSRTTISPFINCLNTMLPKLLQTTKSFKEPLKDELVYKTNIECELTPKQHQVLSLIRDGMKASEARKLSISIFNKLREKGCIYTTFVEKETLKSEIIINDNFKELTSDQKNVYNEFLNSDKRIFELFGVTGSGKTEVYLHLARHYLSMGKQVLIMVPEISLTPQMINRVKERFNDVIFYHSALSDNERYAQYKKVKENKISIVVGTRSSIFLPFNDLGLIIVDEEHDTSYKQDNVPCYYGKNVVIKRCIDFDCKAIFAGATPSLDSYTRALKGEYGLLRLPNRINNTLPEIKLVDLTKEIKKNHNYIISKDLKEQIEFTLNNNKQVIILLNRRGYAPIVKCGDCGTTLMCKDCDNPLNYHKDIDALKCHTCGRIYKNVRYCPKCNSDNLIYYGFGTLKVEEELRKLFPNAKIDRMDRDTTTRKDSHEEILKRFGNKEVDILIGTQMIAKGLDFPDVTLVGILNADAGLAHQDYNSAKLTFDLLMQASGRSGRADNKGLVLIQAFNIEHYVLKAVFKQDYDYFYRIEMNYRHKTLYPPYAHLLAIFISCENKELLDSSVDYLMELVDKLPYKHYRPLELNRIKGKHRTRILISNDKLNPLINDVWDIIDKYLKQKGRASIKVDIDPLYLE